jgi:hypothetical protein
LTGDGKRHRQRGDDYERTECAADHAVILSGFARFVNLAGTKNSRSCFEVSAVRGSLPA